MSTRPPAYSLPIATNARGSLRHRLAAEFADAAFARAVVERLDDETIAAVDAMCGGAMSTCPSLSYQPPSVRKDGVDTVFAFSYGYRFAADHTPPASGVPPMDAIEPGPVNEQIAEAVAAFVTPRPVPVVAQWEIALVLAEHSIAGVVSIEPNVSDDGTTTYLSTQGVLDTGLALAAAGATSGLRPHRVGVFAHVDHAPRCVATARASGLDAGVVAGVTLPAVYDPHSGQLWTRDRVTWVATDLYARTKLAHSTEWEPPT